jgi:hypothetical protein
VITLTGMEMGSMPPVITPYHYRMQPSSLRRYPAPCLYHANQNNEQFCVHHADKIRWPRGPRKSP